MFTVVNQTGLFRAMEFFFYYSLQFYVQQVLVICCISFSLSHFSSHESK